MWWEWLNTAFVPDQQVLVDVQKRVQAVKPFTRNPPATYRPRNTTPLSDSRDIPGKRDRAIGAVDHQTRVAAYEHHVFS